MFPNPEAAFGGSSRLLDVIEDIYGTVEHPSRWPEVLEKFAAVLRGDSIGLYAGAPDARTPDLFSLANITPDAWRGFAEYYAKINVPMERAERLLSPKVTWFTHSIIEDRELERTEVYNDFYKPNRMHYMVGLRLELGNYPAASLSCQRPKSWGAFDEQAETVCETLRPHLARALTLHHQLGAVESRSRGTEAVLDAFGHAVFGLDREGKVVLANGRAEAFARSGEAVRIRGGRLISPDSRANGELQRLIRSATDMWGQVAVEPGGALSLPGGHGARPLQAIVSPFPQRPTAGMQQIAAIVMLVDPAESPTSRGQLLRQLYGLTATEARVADALLKGADVKQVADSLRLTHESARFHVKRVLAKTQTRRQPELMKLMLSLPSLEL